MSAFTNEMITIDQKLTAAPLPCFIRELRDAIREGIKTETRRILDPQPTEKIAEAYHKWTLLGNQLALSNNLIPEPEVEQEWTLTQSQVGALYYLREPLKNVSGYAHYADDDQPVMIASKNQKIPNMAHDSKAEPWREQMKWSRTNGGKLKRNFLPQIHMPAAAARTFVRLTKIWTERLHAITEAAAKAEGVKIPVSPAGASLVRLTGRFVPSDYITPQQPDESLLNYCKRILTYRNHFAALWDSINGTRDGGQWAWKKNPYVIVRQFQLEK